MRVGPIVAAALLGCALWLPFPAALAAGCYGDLSGPDGVWSERIEREPVQSVVQLETLLSAVPPPGRARTTTLSRAHLLALLADAYKRLGNTKAVTATLARAEQAIVPTDSTALRHRLQLARIADIEEVGDYSEAHRQFELTAAAVGDLVRAYEITTAIGADPYRIESGNLLSRVYSVIGFHDDALRLAEDSVRFFQRSGSVFDQAESYFRRGDARFGRNDFAGTEADFRLSIDLFETAGSASDVFYSTERLCEVLVRAQPEAEARKVCSDAERRAVALGIRDAYKVQLARRGEIELRAGRADLALPLLDRALAPGPGEIGARNLGVIYGLRGRARALRGDWRGAFEDTRLDLERLRQDSSKLATDQMAVLNDRLNVRRKDQELLRARDEAASQVRLRNLALVSAALLVLAVVLAALEWRRRHRAETARQAAEQQLAGLARLAGGVAHEFNNLMTIIRQANGLLARRDGVRLDPQAVTLVAEVERASAAGAQVTGQMLSFARQQNLSGEAMRLDAFLHEARAILQRLVGEAVRIDLSIAQPAPTVRCDPRQLMSALINLVTNARDAMPQGGELRILVAPVAPTDAGLVRLEVVDTGTGMTVDVLQHAAEPFFSTKETGKGSGLGLSMVDGFARQSGGRIEISSSPGHGTTVALLLPPDRSA